MPGGGGGHQKSCCSSLFTFLVAAGFAILIYWAIFQPHHIRATVASATLTNLTVVSAAGSTNNTTVVSYRLAVGLAIYNPSLRVSIYFDAIAAELRSRNGGVFLGSANGVAPEEFLQARTSGDTVRLEFDGTGGGGGGGGVPGDVAGELEKEVAAGAVSLEVAVYAQVRYRFASIKIRQKPKIWCSLTIPVNKPEGAGAGAGVGGALASGDRCRVDY